MCYQNQLDSIQALQHLTNDLLIHCDHSLLPVSGVLSLRPKSSFTTEILPHNNNGVLPHIFISIIAGVSYEVFTSHLPSDPDHNDHSHRVKIQASKVSPK